MLPLSCRGTRYLVSGVKEIAKRQNPMNEVTTVTLPLETL